MGKIVNRQELAETFGYSLPTVSAWVEAGCPVAKHGTRGVSFEFDTEHVLRWLLARERGEVKAKVAATIKEDGEVITIDQAKLRYEVARAKTAELDLAKNMELLRPVAQILKVISNEIANARARLLGIPSKVRPTVHLEVGEPEATKRIVNTIETLILEALNEIKALADEPIEGAEELTLIEPTEEETEDDVE
jgi:phage terminase Nu1 subunit (DNA packaging protein)